MGRPLNKRLFGVAGTGPTASGNEIKVNFHNGSAVKEGYIVKQKGSNKFKCSNDGDTITRTCFLTSDGSTPNANNECQIIGIGAGGAAIAIAKITGRKAVDFDGNSYTWATEDDSTESLLRLTAI